MVEDEGKGRGSQPIEEEVAATLGNRVRRQRKAQGLTLQQVADRCGLSQPFLSQIENAKAMPSLMALHNVAQAINTTAHDLLQPEEPLEVSLVRREEGDVFQLVEGASVRFLSRGRGRRIEPNQVDFSAGVGTVNEGHRGEELVFVMEGRLQMELEGMDPVLLEQGDAFSYPATIPHRMSALSDKGCRFLVVTSPPSF